MLLQLAYHVRDRGLLLSDRHVDAFNAGGLLVDDGIDGERGLAGLAIADDQLALAAADRHHRIDRLVTGLHRLADGLAVDHARRHALDRRARLGVERALAVYLGAQAIDHAAEQLRSHGDLEDAAGS